MSNNNIRPEHIEWMNKQLQLRHVRIETGSLLKIMNDFRTKNGPRLAARNIHGDAAFQILNNKLLDVLLQQFQNKSGVQILERAVDDRMNGPSFNEDGTPTQTPPWVDRPNPQSLRAAKKSEIDGKMSKDTLFPKPKLVDFAERGGDNDNSENLPPMDTLYAQLLVEREKETEKMGVSALTPRVHDKHAPSGLTMNANSIQQYAAPVSDEKLSSTVEMELRIANTLPKPIQGSKTLPGVSGVRPMPQILPTSSADPIQPRPVNIIDQSIGMLNRVGQNNSGSLLPTELAIQANGPTKEEFMRIADEHARSDLPKNIPVYNASGAFQTIYGKEAVNPTFASSRISSGYAPIPKYDNKQVGSLVSEGFSTRPSSATSDSSAILPTAVSASRNMSNETRIQWTQERERAAAQLQGPPPNPIMEIGKSILPTYFPEYQMINYYLTIDSIHRDLELYPNANYFQVRFDEPSESVEIPTRLGINGVIIYEQPKTFEYAGGRGAKMFRQYTNVVSIGCTQVIMPMSPRYIYGKPQYIFNGPQIDENKVVNPNQFTSFPYGPVFQSDYGIPRDILDEPYICMHVEELDGLYDGTSKCIREALAVLSYDSKFAGVSPRPFIHFTTASGEKKVYTPTALGKLSQMTIRLLNRTNKLVSLGNDKTYILKIEEGDIVPSSVCDIKPGQHLTKITISDTHIQYGDQPLSGANVDPGDLLYFFTIFPCNPLNKFTPLNSDITLNLTNYPSSQFLFTSGITSTPISVSPFVTIGDIIVVNQLYLFDITTISGDGHVVTLLLRGSSGINVTSLIVTGVGYIKRRRRGLQSDEDCDINAGIGQYVVGTIGHPSVFQVRYPYENLPAYLHSDNAGTYKDNEAFFIRRDHQLVYSLEVSVLQPRTDQLTSRVLSDGGRPM